MNASGDSNDTSALGFANVGMGPIVLYNANATATGSAIKVVSTALLVAAVVAAVVAVAAVEVAVEVAVEA